MSFSPNIYIFYLQSKEGAIPVVKARLKVDNFDQTIDTKLTAICARFSVNLKKGKTQLTTSLLDAQDNEICGAMYVKITRK